MKINLFYLKLPENIYSLKFDPSVIDDFADCQSFLYDLPKRYNEKNKEWIYLYASTDKKKYAKHFESLYDMNLFTKIEKDMEKEEWEIFSKENSLTVLRYVDFSEEYKQDYYFMDDGYIKGLICTKAEYNEMMDSFDILLETKLSEAVSYSADYSFLKEKYILLLDSIMYCTYNKIYSSHIPDTVNELVEYNVQYGISAEGNRFVHPLCRLGEFYLRIFALLLNKGDK